MLFEDEPQYNEASDLSDLRFKYKVKRPTKDTPRSMRAEYIEKFCKRINEEREGTKYKPITPKMLAIRYLGHVKTQDLHWFNQECERAKSFSACFFGKLKVMKDKTP